IEKRNCESQLWLHVRIRHRSIVAALERRGWQVGKLPGHFGLDSLDDASLYQTRGSVHIRSVQIGFELRAAVELAGNCLRIPEPTGALGNVSLQAVSRQLK